MVDRYYFEWQITNNGCAIGGPNALDFTALLCEEPTAAIVRRNQDRTEAELRRQEAMQ